MYCLFDNLQYDKMQCDNLHFQEEVCFASYHRWRTNKDQRLDFVFMSDGKPNDKDDDGSNNKILNVIFWFDE